MPLINLSANGCISVFDMDNKVKSIIDQAEDELQFKTSRSSGAGGQHVNKVETRVTLRWNVGASNALNAMQKSTVFQRLNNHINKEGELIISDESTRSQLKNKDNTIRKWKKLINIAFYQPKKRKKSRVPRAVIEKRRANKKNRSQIKQFRKKPKLDET